MNMVVNYAPGVHTFLAHTPGWQWSRNRLSSKDPPLYLFPGHDPINVKKIWPSLSHYVKCVTKEMQ